MEEIEIQDGTWTQRAPRSRNGVWGALVFEPWIADPRFKRARFILEGGPTVLVSAEDLRRVAAGSKKRTEKAIPLRIDPEKSSINGQPVELHEAA